MRRPSKDELNVERKKRLAEAASPAASATTQAEPVLVAPRLSEVPPADSRPQAAAFRCDGRQHCSQMRSCSEARYFLANCPDVKMDGDRDGTPCEEQWCTHPLAK